MSANTKSVSRPFQSEVSVNKAREQLEKQIAEFLKRDGKIQTIPIGQLNSDAPIKTRPRARILRAKT